ncbi:hypothetical protein DYU05_10340 [Mucilaginibacter terrenus]|uniref:SGNH/GDSL hydrolase family protein n=1 Tax=Mucilaginibacter terrenus TaxID=2482727 RepID=A0A3E2NY90_9SPHI|nr:hypothetical protein [Mucilaginibacter terrenus]RFZ85957.1 hypothetical protein DYU05_10340 [Mucilaginibacter terrenus]
MADKKLIAKKLIILLILMFVLDRGIGALLEHFYFTQKSGFDARANYIINKTNADVLVFGSSKAAEHYDPSILSDSLKMSVYNCGRDLSYIYYHYGLLQAVLKRYTPKLIILDTRPNEFQIFKYRENLDRLNVLLPYYDSHPELREVCLLRDKFERYKMLSKIYPYNSLILYEMVQFLPKYQKDNSENGFIGKTGEWHGNKPAYNVNDEVDTTAALYYKKFIESCRAKGIKVVITMSPIYQTIDVKANRNIALIYQIARKNNVPVFNYLTSFTNPKYFYDDLHLNRSGAELLSSKIAQDVKSVYRLK